MNRRRALIALAAGASAPARAAGADAVCVVPAKPGGGFDLTCRLAQVALQPVVPALQIDYLPGGIGALAIDDVVRRRPADARRLIAFSSGSLLNLAQGRFGPYSERDVRWVAALAMDHGVIAVHRDAPWPTLAALVAALRDKPGAIVFGAGGTIGSQDWMKAALLARSAGVGHKAMRLVAFEGGGEALQALAGRHVQVLAGDAAEVGQQIAQGAPVRVLAVLAAQRLPGRWREVPTAREQGFDIRWPILRGLYVGPQVADEAVRGWTEAFAAAQARPAFVQARERLGLQPVDLAGRTLAAFVTEQMALYRALALDFGLMRPELAPAGASR